MKIKSIFKQYDYSLPKDLIAQKPSNPRDKARLLVYPHTKNAKAFYGVGVPPSKKILHDRFINLPKYLPENSVLVFNQTKVIPARIIVRKETGGRVKLLYIGKDKNYIKVLANKKLDVGQKLAIVNGSTSLLPSPRLKRGKFVVVKKTGQFYFLKPNFKLSKLPSIFSKYGQTPLPPYLKHSPLKEAERKKFYQTVFAKTGESVAAPTASLHFTKRLMQRLQKNGIKILFVNLNVNLGTFAPLTEENIKTGKLHTETYEINKKTLENIKLAKQQRKPIIAVGTTVVRTLESFAKTGKLTGATDLFIRPPYNFKIIDGIITNFHVPKSSLMMLVASLVGRKKLLDIYRLATEKRYKFFSFGDGMFIF